MARKLGLPIRTWYNYESGVTVPAEVLLRFMELTAVEPLWLLHGKGPRFRTMPNTVAPESSPTVESLLRTALQHLERKNQNNTAMPKHEGDGEATLGRVVSPPGDRRSQQFLPGEDQNGSLPSMEAQREWLVAQQEDRCVRVVGDDMAPIVADGAQVAFSGEEEPAEDLDGALVVSWVENRPVVRWFRHSGRYGLLRAENPDHKPSILLVDLNAPEPQRRVRRVLWISTPH